MLYFRLGIRIEIGKRHGADCSLFLPDIFLAKLENLLLAIYRLFHFVGMPSASVTV